MDDQVAAVSGRGADAAGHAASAPTVGRLLRENGFSLQANAKALEGAQHADRDAQFRYVNGQVKDYQADGEPVVSVDTKKKEVVGEFKNAGRQWRPAGEPVRVDVHDFPGDALGKALPYGIYDLAADTGWVNVGTDHDTAAFAVESIRRWWNGQGRIVCRCLASGGAGCGIVRSGKGERQALLLPGNTHPDTVAEHSMK
ncbi:hypothetical protein QF035_006772 [Streptomyces umbrinus]|uniref:Transposase n=1 Tax=Streptomyces umbrinus TaxID=67370 RepID=A0ABU0T058_9ACTN|nr:hypothetical protein [Streptomyces umbrinus]